MKLAARRIALWHKAIRLVTRMHLKTAMGWKPHRGFESHALRFVTGDLDSYGPS